MKKNFLTQSRKKLLTQSEKKLLDIHMQGSWLTLSGGRGPPSCTCDTMRVSRNSSATAMQEGPAARQRVDSPARKSSRQGRRRAPRLWRRGWGCHLLLSTGDAMTTRGKTGMTPSSETAILIFNFENSPQPTTGGIPWGGMLPEGKTTKTRNPQPLPAERGGIHHRLKQDDERDEKTRTNHFAGGRNLAGTHR